MALVILIAGLTFFIVYRSTPNKKKLDRVKYGLFFVSFNLFIYCIIMAGVCKIFEKIDNISFTYNVIEETRYELVATRPASSSQGKFFLFSGGYESIPYYYYYYKTADNGYMLSKLHAEKATIFEGDYEKAYLVETIMKKFFREWVFWTILPTYVVSQPPNYYAFIVPEGTVKRDVGFDLGDL